MGLNWACILYLTLKGIIKYYVYFWKYLLQLKWFQTRDTDRMNYRKERCPLHRCKKIIRQKTILLLEYFWLRLHICNSFHNIRYEDEARHLSEEFFFVGELQLCLHMLKCSFLECFVPGMAVSEKSDVQRPLETALLNYM